MNRSICLVQIVALLAVVTQASHAQKTGSQLEKEGYKRYAMSSAIVEYKLSGVQSGKETIRFDRWGLREANLTETEVKAGGMTIPSKSETIMDGEFTYALDRDANTATKTHNTLLTQISATHKTKDLEEVGEKTLKAMNATKTGTETFLGKKCDVWEVKNLGTKMWVYKGLTLKSETNMSGMKVIREAVKFEENAKVPEDKLTVSSKMKVTEGGNPMDMLKQMKSKKKK
ncbi:MAG: hypothetical protein KF749_08785 [Bacteroidetes bacterium]|nr:hypothetical protein [Bacteroidota bacterium]MCW5895898.1 hypothetical protein [Bacteroidota bacterium]